MKILFSFFLLLCSFSCFSQITFEDVLSFELKSFKEIQSALFEDYTIFEDFKEYRYIPIKECQPPKYSEDGCQWICTQSNYLDVVKSKFPLDKVIFKKSSNKNYEVWLTLKSSFGENYNSETKRAKTFIYVSERKTWSNNNCQNKMTEGKGIGMPLEISIQFADPEHWKTFKSSVTRNATFQQTWQGSKDSQIEFRYGIRRYMINGYWKGIFINLYESGPTYHASIYFDSGGVD